MCGGGGGGGVFFDKGRFTMIVNRCGVFTFLTGALTGVEELKQNNDIQWKDLSLIWTPLDQIKVS